MRTYIATLFFITARFSAQAQHDISIRQSFSPTPYHWAFAGITLILFFGALIWAYGQDEKKTPEYYRSGKKVFILIICFTIILITVKFRGYL